MEAHGCACVFVFMCYYAAMYQLLQIFPSFCNSGRLAMCLYNYLCVSTILLCTGGRVIEDEEGEIPSTCTYKSMGKCNMTNLDVYA